MKLGARLSHYALYALMIGAAADRLGDALGRCLSDRAPTRHIRLPAIVPQSDALHALLWNAHFYLAFAFFALVLLRLAAALCSTRLVRRDVVFGSMAPVTPPAMLRPAE